MVSGTRKNSKNSRSSGRRLNAKVKKSSRDNKYRMGVIVMIPVCIALVSVILWLLFKLVAGVLFTNNDRYAITDINIKAGRVMTEEVILGSIPVKKGDNIFNFSLGEVREKIASAPTVLYVDVRRVLPSVVEIEVTERVSIAKVGRFGVDKTGVVFAGPSSASTMPSIENYTPSAGRIMPGVVLEGKMARAALEFLDVCEAPGVDLKVRSIDVSAREWIGISLRNGKRIDMSWQAMGAFTEESKLAMELQIRRILVVMNTERGSRKKYYDARYPGEIIVNEG